MGSKDGTMASIMIDMPDVECPFNHTPNKETIKAIQDCENEEDLVEVKDAKDLFEKLGIEY